MAIATATALTAAGLAITAGTATMSFVQAGKQKDAQRQAERDANEAMANARKKLDVNFYNQLGIKKEPYELEREALLSQGAQAIQAGAESERGAAATAGRVQMAQQEGQAGIRQAMGQELTGLEKLSAQEDSRLRDVGIQLDLGEVSGAQLAAKNAAQMSAQAMQQGFQGVTSMGQQIASFAPLYEKSQSADQFTGLQGDYSNAIKNNTLGSQFMGANGKPLPFQQAIQQMGANQGGVGYGFDLSGVGSMNTNLFQDYMTKQSSANIQALRKAGFGQ